MTDAETAPAAAPVPPAVTGRVCENCGHALLGETCYACGQPTKGLIREFSTILGDFFDTLLNIDSRIVRTIGPLFARPGALSLEYFAGHRVRYVSPVRLFMFLSILAFVLAQWSLDVNVGTDTGGVQVGRGKETTNNQMGRAKTIPEVEHLRDEALAELAKAREESKDVPGVAVGLDIAKTKVSEAAERRIAEIRDGKPPSPEWNQTPGSFQFNDKPWDAKTNPITVSWLPEAGNRKLNEWIGRASGNLKRGSQDPDLIKNAFLSVVPQTLFVLLPLFAVLLKIAYAFKRRLYMEHLIVALHSHAFLCLCLALLSVLSLLDEWVGVRVAFLSGTIGWLEFGVAMWMPIYLLIMQKRVYRQGWIMTLLKYFVLGVAYSIMLSFGALAALLISLVWM